MSWMPLKATLLSVFVGGLGTVLLGNPWDFAAGTTFACVWIAAINWREVFK